MRITSLPTGVVALVRPAVVLALAAAGLSSAGCESSSPVDLVATKKVVSMGLEAPSATQPTSRPTAWTNAIESLDAPAPTVVQEGETVVISGTIARRPAASVVPLTPGSYFHIDIDSSNPLDSNEPIPVALQPAVIPLSGQGVSTYSIRLGSTLPAGSKVRLIISDPVHSSSVGGGGVVGAAGPSVVSTDQFTKTQPTPSQRSRAETPSKPSISPVVRGRR